MYKKLVTLFSFFAVFALAGIALAGPPVTQVVEISKASTPASITIPAHAVEVAEGVFSLGTSVDSRGREVQGFMVFHHKAGHSGGPGGGNDTTTTSQCYALFAKDAKWRDIEDYSVNTSNNAGLSEADITAALTAGMTEWENGAGAEIFGNGSVTTDTLEADLDAPDSVNEVYFAPIEGDGTIAFTLVWGIFNGPPFARELVSWDMVFDDEDYAWGDADIDPTVMDLLNITTHELGHAGGLTHPENTCTLETMHAFGTEGETIKRDLHDGDITGINKLY